MAESAPPTLDSTMTQPPLYDVTAAIVQATDVPNGVEVWMTGQAGVVVRAAGRTLYFDPYLSNNVGAVGGQPKGYLDRLVPDILDPTQLTTLDAIFCSHEHIDHTDIPGIKPLMAAAPHAKIVGSYGVRDELERGGVNLNTFVMPPTDADFSLFDNVTIHAIPSAHTADYKTEFDAQGNSRWMGYIVKLPGVTIYHSGDTVLYDGMIERLRPHTIDLAFLPINGRDFQRESPPYTLVGNLHPAEALYLAESIGARALIPMHNDMFALNRQNPALLLDAAFRRGSRQIIYYVPAGGSFVYRRA